MSDIVPRCSVHGEIMISADQALLLISPTPNRSRLRFPCQKCGAQITCFVSPTQAHMLREGGVPVQVLVGHPELDVDHHGPAIVVDDVLDLVLDLRRIAAVAEVANSEAAR